MDDDSDDGGVSGKHKLESASSAGDASARPRPAKRRRQDVSVTHVSGTVDLSENATHVSDTILEPSTSEAPIAPASAPGSDAESPILSTEQVAVLFWAR